MKKLKEFLNYKGKNYITFSIIFIITCIIFIPLLKGHYATDTYNIANIGYKEYSINWSLKDGRVVMSLIGLLAEKLDINIDTYVFITLFLALIISNIAVIYLKNIINKYKVSKNIFQEIILTIISYITIFNFMYLENMYFVESVVMAISVLLFLISANILVNREKESILKSMMLTIIGIICYQGTIGMFFAFVILFTILKNENDAKQIIIDIIKCGFIALIAALLNIATVKIVCDVFNIKQTRLGDISNIFKNIITIIVTLPKIMRETCNLFPKYLFIGFLFVLSIIIIIYKVKTIKEKNNIISKFILISIITIAGSSLTYILTLTSFYTGRLRNALGALIGIIFLLLYVETDLFTNNFKKNIKLSIVTYLTLISFTIINIANYESIIMQHKEVNKLEKQEIIELDKYIEKYENYTGIKVTKIVKVPIQNNKDKGYFSSIKNKTSFTHNALKTTWASDGVVNFYTNRNLKTIKATQNIKEMFFKNQNNQLEYQCINDILYVKVYIY